MGGSRTLADPFVVTVAVAAAVQALVGLGTLWLAHRTRQLGEQNLELARSTVSLQESLADLERTKFGFDLSKTVMDEGRRLVQELEEIGLHEHATVVMEAAQVIQSDPKKFELAAAEAAKAIRARVREMDEERRALEVMRALLRERGPLPPPGRLGRD